MSLLTVPRSQCGAQQRMLLIFNAQTWHRQGMPQADWLIWMITLAWAEQPGPLGDAASVHSATLGGIARMIWRN